MSQLFFTASNRALGAKCESCLHWVTAELSTVACPSCRAALVWFVVTDSQRRRIGKSEIAMVQARERRIDRLARAWLAAGKPSSTIADLSLDPSDAELDASFAGIKLEAEAVRKETPAAAQLFPKSAPQSSQGRGVGWLVLACLFALFVIIIKIRGCSSVSASQETEERSLPAWPSADCAGRACRVQPSEASVADFAACSAAGACSGSLELAPGVVSREVLAPLCTRARGGDYPANCLTPNQAVELCAWLGGVVPTAVEWLSAVRWRERSDALLLDPNAACRINTCDVSFVSTYPELARKSSKCRSGGQPLPCNDSHAGPAPGGAARGDEVEGLRDVVGNLLELVRVGPGFAAYGRSFAYGLERPLLPVGLEAVGAEENGVQIGVRCVAYEKSARR